MPNVDGEEQDGFCLVDLALLDAGVFHPDLLLERIVENQEIAFCPRLGARIGQAHAELRSDVWAGWNLIEEEGEEEEDKGRKVN